MDRTQFEDAYNLYFDYVFNYIYRRTANMAEAEDVTAETFIALWKNWSSYDHRQSLKAWVFGIAAHKLQDFWRQKYKLEIQVNLNDSEWEKIPATETDARLKSKNYENILQSLVSELSEREQVFVNLRFKQSLTLKQVAQELGITENNAKVIQNRLVKTLKALWEAHLKI